MNDALRGCGIPAVVEETETKQVVAVSFPGVVGVPEDFARRKERVEAILPATFRWSIALRKQQEKVCEGALCRTIKFKKFFEGRERLSYQEVARLGKISSGILQYLGHRRADNFCAIIWQVKT